MVKKNFILGVFCLGIVFCGQVGAEIFYVHLSNGSKEAVPQDIADLVLSYKKAHKECLAKLGAFEDKLLDFLIDELKKDKKGGKNKEKRFWERSEKAQALLDDFKIKKVDVVVATIKAINQVTRDLNICSYKESAIEKKKKKKALKELDELRAEYCNSMHEFSLVVTDLQESFKKTYLNIEISAGKKINLEYLKEQKTLLVSRKEKCEDFFDEMWILQSNSVDGGDEVIEEFMNDFEEA